VLDYLKHFAEVTFRIDVISIACFSLRRNQSSIKREGRENEQWTLVKVRIAAQLRVRARKVSPGKVESASRVFLKGPLRVIVPLGNR